MGIPADDSQDLVTNLRTLREALRPFSALGCPSPTLANYYDIPSDVVIFDDGSGHVITAGDIRRANTAMLASVQALCAQAKGE